MTRERLLSDFNPGHWAEDFVKFAEENPGVAQDEAAMYSWFAAALDCGYDTALRRDAEDE